VARSYELSPLPARALRPILEDHALGFQVVAQAIGTGGNPAQYLIAQKYLESLGQIAADADKLVFLPYEAAGVMGAIGGMRELFKNPPVPAAK